jgi:hypothetical protein
MQRWNDSDGLSFVGLGASKTNESIAEPVTRTHPYNLSNIIDDDIISAIINLNIMMKCICIVVWYQTCFLP